MKDSALYDTTAVDEPPLPQLAPVVLPNPVPTRFSKGGRVKVGAIVGGDGVIEPASVSVIVPVDSILDEEAQRIVRSTAFWPGCDDGGPVRVRIAFDVSFYEGGPNAHGLGNLVAYLGILVMALIFPDFFK